MSDDPVLLNDWHPVAASDAVMPGTPVASRLVGRDLVLWRGGDGAVRAWADRCPHRGTRLSLGRIESDQLICAYHGWRYGADGRCTHMPARPDQRPPRAACVTVYRAAERYGLVWVCAGDPAQEVLPFPEYGDPALRKVVCGPYEVATSGPRIVENFLDMAHFGFIHGGILGDAGHTEVRDYKVATLVGGGVLATECFCWQPQTNSLAHGGSEVEYTYRVVRPLTAILTKVPQAQAGFREAISLHVQPIEEEASRVWFVLALTNFEQNDADVRGFQDRIFAQDRPIVENQSPKRLPLAAGAEVSIGCDRMSMAYRRYLRETGLRYGVLPGDD